MLPKNSWKIVKKIAKRTRMWKNSEKGKQDWESNLRSRVGMVQIKLRPCQDHVMFVKTMSSLSTPCHFCQDHVMFFKTMSSFTWPCHVCHRPIWSNLIQFDPNWFYNMFLQHVFTTCFYIMFFTSCVFRTLKLSSLINT